MPPSKIPSVPARTRRGGGGGKSRRFLKKNRGQPRRSARSEQNPAKKFSSPFRRKNPARAKSEMQRKLFCWLASVSERRRAGFISRGSFGKKFGFHSGGTESLRPLPRRVMRHKRGLVKVVG